MYLECPEQNNKFLAVDITGEVACKELTDPTSDKVWNQIEPKNEDLGGFYLVSDGYRMALDYNPNSRGEEIYGRSFSLSSKKHTLWNRSENNEIYTLDENGDKKFLWPMLDGIYVTPDENMAERWTPVSLEGYDIDPKPQESKSNHRIYIYIWFLIFIVTLYLIFMGKM